MKIEIKPIRIKTNEWQPTNGIRFSQEKLADIINEENLKTDMDCVLNVKFDSLRQIFSNVQINCDEYKDEYIYLLKCNFAESVLDYFWVYVVNKQFNTAKKVILTLKIDGISSTIRLFNVGSFAGEVYIERTNNYQREINNIHSDACAGIENNQFEYKKLNTEVNRQIDIFIDQKTRTINRIPPAVKGYMIVKGAGPGTQWGFDRTTYGTVFIDGLDDSFLAYNSTISLNGNPIRNQELPTFTIQKLLDIWASAGTKYNDDNWYFDSSANRATFVDRVGEYGKNNTQLDDITRIGNDSENVNWWLSVPKFFTFDEKGVIAYFDYEIDKSIFDFSEKKHLDLHYNFFLVIGKTFKIPLDFIKLQQKIWITRIVSQQNVIFQFSYTSNRTENFYEVTMATANGINSDAWKEYQRNLDIAYNTGVKGDPFDIFKGIIGKAASIGLGTTIAANTFNKAGENGLNLPFFGGLATGIASTIFGSAFSIYSNYKKEKYDAQMVLSKGNEAKNILLFEALNDIIFFQTEAASYGKIYVNRPEKTTDAYFLLTKELITPNITNLNFMVLKEKPISVDIKKIELDQQQYGNVVSQTFLDVTNPLEFNDLSGDNLFWQGVIQPKINPVSIFLLSLINDELGAGTKILKK